MIAENRNKVETDGDSGRQGLSSIKDGDDIQLHNFTTTTTHTHTLSFGLHRSVKSCIQHKTCDFEGLLEGGGYTVARFKRLHLLYGGTSFDTLSK